MLKVSRHAAAELLRKYVEQGQTLIERASLIGDSSDYESWKPARKQWIELTTETLNQIFDGSAEVDRFKSAASAPAGGRRWQTEYHEDSKCVQAGIDVLISLKGRLEQPNEGSELAQEHAGPEFSQEPNGPELAQQPADDAVPAEEPLGSLAAHDHARSVAAEEPVGSVAAEEPLGSLAAQDHAGSVAAEEPVGSVAVEEPLGSLAAQDHAGSVAAEEPVGSVATEEPVGSELAAPSVGSELAASSNGSALGQGSSEDAEFLEGSTNGSSSSLPATTSKPKADPTRQVFLVHGANETWKQAVAGLLERAGPNEVTILNEQPNDRKRLVAGFEGQSAGSPYAVVLLTADDVGASRLDSDREPYFSPRARQRVVFEMGVLIAALTPRCVCVLYEDGVELPCDLDGIAYVRLDLAGAWQSKLLLQLRGAGFDYDLNSLAPV
jgi:predicted nucleotide-binding protein